MTWTPLGSHLDLTHSSSSLFMAAPLALAGPLLATPPDLVPAPLAPAAVISPPLPPSVRTCRPHTHTAHAHTAHTHTTRGLEWNSRNLTVKKWSRSETSAGETSAALEMVVEDEGPDQTQDELQVGVHNVWWCVSCRVCRVRCVVEVVSD